MTISTLALYNKQYVLKIANTADIVLLDIDDVIITPNQYLCSTSWYGRYHTLNKGILSPHTLIQDFYTCMNRTEYQAVNLDLIEDMSNLANEKSVLGFTARIVSFAPETHSAIKKTGMKFSSFADNMHENIQNGVIYVGYNIRTGKSNNNGDFLAHLLQMKKFEGVKSILFIDDTLRNLQEVKDALPSHINFYGIHFTEAKARLFCDYEQKDLDAISDYQFEHMHIDHLIPSNNEALQNIFYSWSNYSNPNLGFIIFC